MSREELKKYIPDTPAEWQLIAKYVNGLGTAMSATLLFSADKGWVLVSLFLTWAGGSAADYFGQNQTKQK